MTLNCICAVVFAVRTSQKRPSSLVIVPSPSVFSTNVKSAPRSISNFNGVLAAEVVTSTSIRHVSPTKTLVAVLLIPTISSTI